MGQLTIDDYIRFSRIEKRDQRDDSQAVSYYEQIKEMLNRVEKDLPEIRICYSINRKCEQVSLNDKDYLIYDRYFGQSLSILNAMFFSPKTTDIDVLRYMNKCDAEMYYCSGQPTLAAIKGLIYEELMKTSDVASLYSSGNRVAIYFDTMFQELFVLLHEICHWRLKKRGDKTELIQKKRSHLLHNKSVERYSKKYLIQTDSEETERRADEIRWLSSDANVEELLCDEYALIQLIKIFQSFSMVSMFFKNLSKQIAETCIICLDNYNTLSVAQWDVDCMNEGVFLKAAGNPEDFKPELREGLIEDSEYRRQFFIFDTIMENLEIHGDKESFLEGIVQLHAVYMDKIFNVAYNKHIEKLMPDLIKESDVSKQYEDVLSRIPNWGTVNL